MAGNNELRRIDPSFSLLTTGIKSALASRVCRPRAAAQSTHQGVSSPLARVSQRWIRQLRLVQPLSPPRNWLDGFSFRFLCFRGWARRNPTRGALHGLDHDTLGLYAKGDYTVQAVRRRPHRVDTPVRSTSRCCSRSSAPKPRSVRSARSSAVSAAGAWCPASSELHG